MFISGDNETEDFFQIGLLVSGESRDNKIEDFFTCSLVVTMKLKTILKC